MLALLVPGMLMGGGGTSYNHSLILTTRSQASDATTKSAGLLNSDTKSGGEG